MGTITNVKVEPMEITWGSSGLGFSDGDIELTITENAVDVVAHQEGTNILTAIRTGHNIEAITVTLKETNMDLIKYMLGQAGDTYTPSGGTEVLAIGNSKDFTSMLTEANKLVLHPVVLAANDYSRDLAFWKACPQPGAVTFSGENPMMVSVQFRVFPDSTKLGSCRLGVWGDHTQDFSA